MNWKVASWTALALWSSYCIFGDKANKIHGARVTMIAEALCIAAVTVFALFGGSNLSSDFSKVTLKSAVFAITMGLMSAGGIYLQFTAFQNAKGTHDLALIAMITGFWPVVTVFLTALLGTKLTPHQWLGVALSSAGLYLVNKT